MLTSHSRMGPACLLAGAWLLAGVCHAESGTPARDWPQFHGPRRDNLSTETGLLKRWPDGGPKLLWKATGIGQGWATVSISGGSIYTAGVIGPDATVTAMDMGGKRRWRVKIGPAGSKKPIGARATPTVAGGKLYCHSGDGDVTCLEAATGRRLWTVNVLKRFGGRNIRWGLSESLLVDGRRVICCPGGERVALAALDKDTGKTVWTCTGLGDKPGYVAPVLVDFAGLRQIVTIMANHAVGVAAERGTLLWKYPHKVRFEANCVTPVYHAGHVVLAGTWGRGATLLKLNVRDRACTVREVWRTKELDNEHGGIVLVDGSLYGQADGNHEKRHWACLDFKTGKTMWASGGLPGRTGTLTYADGMLYMMNDRRTVALAPARATGLQIVSRFDLPKAGRGMSWAHPVVFGGRLYIRYGDFLYVYDVRAHRLRARSGRSS